MDRLSVADAQARLAELLDRAAAGEEILITREDGSGVRLVPVDPPLRPPLRQRTWHVLDER